MFQVHSVDRKNVVSATSENNEHIINGRMIHKKLLKDKRLISNLENVTMCKECKN